MNLSKISDNKRNYLIDFLRFIAALWVTLFHFNEPIKYIDNGYRNIVKLGYLGVPIFFVISGYCIMMAALNSKSALAFLIRRFFRILPLYWLSLIIVIFAAIVQRLVLGNNTISHPNNLSSLFATLVLYTQPLSKIPTINWVYWSLSCEVAFYLVVYIGLNFKKKYLIYYFILVSVIAIFVEVPTNTPFFFLQFWPAFALGLGTYYIHNGEDFNFTKTLVTILIAVNLGALYKHLGFARFAGDKLTTYYFIATLITSLLILLSPIISLKQNFFSKLGDYSYGVYLIHVPIGIFILKIFKTPAIQQKLVLNIGYDILCYVIVSIFAAIIYKYVELPAINVGKKVTGKPKIEPAK